MLWDLNKKNKIDQVLLDIFNANGELYGIKKFYAYDDNMFITDWYRMYHNRKIEDKNIGSIGLYGSDFQHSNYISINNPSNHPNRWSFISHENLIHSSIYFTVRHCIEATWLNDRDQFLYLNDGWQTDKEFQNDCLAFTLFRNNITTSLGTNHWIPFTEQEVNAQAKFESNFMTDFMKGKISPALPKGEGEQQTLFQQTATTPTTLCHSERSEESHKSSATLCDSSFVGMTKREYNPLIFSPEANAVFEAGRELWTYYHKTASQNRNVVYNVNASLYDIREYFQGRNDKGRMNSKSDDTRYMELIGALRSQLVVLADKIKLKVYEYGFLKE
jgi:hypothetical protein